MTKEDLYWRIIRENLLLDLSQTYKALSPQTIDDILRSVLPMIRWAITIKASFQAMGALPGESALHFFMMDTRSDRTMLDFMEVKDD